MPRSARISKSGFTLLELMIAMTVMLMVVGALAGLARTVEQGYQYSEGYGIATQHARIVLDRIAQNVCQAAANEQFPGCLVVAETVNSYRYPDTLVVWRPGGDASSPTGLGRTPADPAGLPRYNELLIYCPDPSTPSHFVELTAPGDSRTVAAADDASAWQAALAALKKDKGTKSLLLSDLLRTCSTSTGGSGLRGAVRFETRLRPSANDWASYKTGGTTWMNLPWVQGIYGSQAGLRQVWVRTELQLVPGVTWVESSQAADAVPYLGSAALYYQLTHP
jgi:prepilin-type N-terminal cleavage/methylation domain-containing protein